MDLLDFIAAAKAQGAQDEFLAALLRQRGWSTKEVQGAFAKFYETRTGLEIPAKPGQGEAARDAFLYLLAFTTLTISAWGWAALMFGLLDAWLPEQVVTNQYWSPPSLQTYMAQLLIAFPAFLWLMRLIGKSEAEAGARSSSAVARWLTYLSLFLTATIAICDLMVAVEHLLKGELTLRFVLKVTVVLLVAAGIFFYFFERLLASQMRWGPLLGWGSSALVAASLVAALLVAGAPTTQRKLEADRKRVQDLKLLARDVRAKWQEQPEADRKLPAQFDQLRILRDPETKASYQYMVDGGSRYRLCASFDLPSSAQPVPEHQQFWPHPAGYHCYELNVQQIY